MKKYGIVAAIVAVIVAGVWGWSSMHKRNDSMASSLPADVTMVGRVDIKTLFMEYGLSPKEILKAVNKFLFYSNDDDSGIDFLTSAYVFSSQGYFGAVIPLSSEKKFEEFWTSKVGFMVESQRGLKWTNYGDNFLMVFDKDRAVLMGPAVGSQQDYLRNTLADCMKQKASESGMQSRLYEALSKRPEPVAMTANLESMPKDFFSSYLDWIPAVDGLKDLDICTGLTLKKDRIQLSLSMLSGNKAVEQIQSKFDEAFRPVNGSLLKTAPANAFFHIEMGVDGAKLLTLLREYPEVRTKLLLVNTIFDLDMILKSISGDVAISCPKIPLINKPDVLMQAQLDSDDFMQNVGDWNDDISMAANVRFFSKDALHGLCIAQGERYYFAVSDNVLRISNSEGIAYADAHNDMKYAMEDEMKDCRIYASVNLKGIKPWLQMIPYAGSLAVFEQLRISVPDAHELKAELVMEEGTDLLKTIMNYLEKQ